LRIIYDVPMGRFVFGPVPSRRLGFSLGVDIIPKKICSFDCIYCQIGKTTKKAVARASYFDTDEIVGEVTEALSQAPHVDYVSLSGSGEPTLNADLGRIIGKIRERTKVPVAVITNGSLLFLEDVRRDLSSADVVLPSLDAASEDIFRYINRPHGMIEIETIVEGLSAFRHGYEGQIWLEIMLVKDVNDDPEELRALRTIVNSLRLDRIQLNTITRPPSELIGSALSHDSLIAVRDFFGSNCEIISRFEKRVKKHLEKDWTEMVLQILGRRSLSLDDIVKITGCTFEEAREKLEGLEREGAVERHYFGNGVYYVTQKGH
jgi:wyosine [tRNA(Phe)-imidazoG37] synthetase (radical SAM superfamily)